MKNNKLTENEIVAFQKHVQFLKEKGVKNDTLVTYTKFVRRSAGLFRTTMYAMRYESQDIMTEKEQKRWLKDGKQPRHKICGHNFSFMNQSVELVKTEHGNMAFRGLAQCGSIWRCPFCSFKILEKKREEIYQFYKLHHLSGLQIGFITLTIRHKKEDSLQQTIKKLTDNFRGFQNARWYQKHKHYYKGFVKSTEITYTKKGGWHPHFHFLYFYNQLPNEKLSAFHDEFIERWASFRNNNSLSYRQDAKFANDELIVQYIGKWDIVKEITGNAVKTSKGGVTPFQLLKLITLKHYDNFSQRNTLVNLWREYLTFTKGKPRIRISKNLKESYPSVKISTEEQALKDITVDEMILKIQWQIWLQIAKKKLQPHLINFYLHNNLEGIYTLLKRSKIDFDIQTNEKEEIILV